MALEHVVHPLGLAHVPEHGRWVAENDAAGRQLLQRLRVVLEVRGVRHGVVRHRDVTGDGAGLERRHRQVARRRPARGLQQVAVAVSVEPRARR